MPFWVPAGRCAERRFWTSKNAPCLLVLPPKRLRFGDSKIRRKSWGVPHKFWTLELADRERLGRRISASLHTTPFFGARCALKWTILGCRFGSRPAGVPTGVFGRPKMHPVCGFCPQNDSVVGTPKSAENRGVDPTTFYFPSTPTSGTSDCVFSGRLVSCGFPLINFQWCFRVGWGVTLSLGGFFFVGLGFFCGGSGGLGTRFLGGCYR